MGGKSGISLPKVKIAAPKITVGKDLGMKNIGKVAHDVVKATGKAGEDIGRGVGKGATAAYQTAGKYGSALTKTLGKGAEGLVANAADLGENLAQGDFKGMGKEALELLQSGKDIAKGLTKAQAGLATGALGAVGSSLSDKNITGAAKNIEREGNKGVDKYGDAAIDAGISAIPGVGQGYALAKMAAGGLSKDGLSSLTSMKGLQDMAIEAGASKLGINPNLAKMGMAATSGDLKGAALQGLGSFAGLSPDQMKMATTGAAALTGDKKGLASGLASQFGAGDSVANMVGSAADGDVKGALLGKLAGATGVPQDILKQVSTGKFDVGELAKNANLTASLGDTAKAYLPGSMQNLVSQGEKAAGLARDQVKGIQDVQKAAESTYKIAKGDTLGAIAKKMGVDVKALAAANGIKDINKISAGMNLKMPNAKDLGLGDAQKQLQDQFKGVNVKDLPGAATVSEAQTRLEGARKSITDKYLKDANGKTIYGPNNAPVANPDYNQDEADKLAIQQQGGTGKEITLPEEPGFLDKAKDFLGGVGDKISGAVGAAGKFVQENPMAVSAGIQGAATAASYVAGKNARDAQEALIEQQIERTQGVQALQNYKLSKERDKAYQEQQQFLEDRIAGGGMTAKEREMQQQGQMRAAKMAAAGRLAGVEQQARMGQGVTGAGSALAASLAGAQAQAQAGAESERAAATSAGENLEKAYSARPAALEAKAKTEMDLAQQQDLLGLSRVAQIGTQTAAQRALEQAGGEANIKAIGAGADLATRVAQGGYIGPSDATDKEKEIAAQAQADKDKAARDAKTAAAANVSGTAPTQGNAQTAAQPTTPKPAPQTQADKFNQAGQAPKPQPTPVPAPQPGQGQGYGVLAPTSKPANPMDAMMNIVKNPAQAIKNPQQAIQTAQQVAKNPQAALDAAKKKAEEAAKSAATKAVGGLVPDSLKNVFGMKK